MDGSFVLGLLCLSTDRGVGFKPLLAYPGVPRQAWHHISAYLLAQC